MNIPAVLRSRVVHLKPIALGLFGLDLWLGEGLTQLHHSENVQNSSDLAGNQQRYEMMHSLMIR